MDKYNLPKGWKYEVFDEIENQIASYYSSLTDYGYMIKFSNSTLPKISKIVLDYDDYVHIKKQDLQNITFEQLLFYLKNIEPKKNQSKKDCLIDLLNRKKIKYEEALWAETS